MLNLILWDLVQVVWKSLHAVVLRVHVVVWADVGLRALRWILWRLPIIGAILMSSWSSSRHLRTVNAWGVGHLVSSSTVFVGGCAYIHVLLIVLGIVIFSTRVLGRHPVSAVSLVLLVRTLVVAHHRCRLWFLTSDKRVIRSRNHLLGRNWSAMVGKACWTFSLLSLVDWFIMVVAIKEFLNTGPLQFGLMLLHRFWIRILPFAISVLCIEVVLCKRWDEWSLDLLI